MSIIKVDSGCEKKRGAYMTWDAILIFFALVGWAWIFLTTIDGFFK